ncbi:MAG: ABC transporter permease [Clostridiales bacterium]
MKRILTIFARDLKVNRRDFLSLYIMVIPILFGIAINLIAPSVNDTTINIALIENENLKMEEYLKDFAKVYTYKNIEEIEERVNGRDELFAYVSNENGYYVLYQGNEMEELVDYAKMLLVFFEEDVEISDSTSTIHDFGQDVPPLKKLLVNILMMFSAVLGGMLIAINIIEEKVDRTIRAIHLTPISRTGYILGKSIIGILIPFYGSVAMLVITGFTDINWFQMMLLVFVSMVISILFGFIQGIKNTSVMDAAGSVKMLFLPLAGAVAVAELLGQKWQWIVYWVPFYWTYKGVDEILTYNSSWQNTLMYSGIVLVISICVYLLLMPGIRKGLE